MSGLPKEGCVEQIESLRLETQVDAFLKSTA